MIKKIIIVVVIILTIAGYYISTRVYSKYGNKIVSVSINNTTLYAEVVQGKDKLAKGLGSRGGLCSSCGMLFLFQNAGTHAFWMKDMQLPIDIIWILQKKVVHIEKNLQPLSSGKIFSPPGESDVVLEINAGMSDKFGIEVGSIVDF